MKPVLRDLKFECTDITGKQVLFLYLNLFNYL